MPLVTCPPYDATSDHVVLPNLVSHRLVAHAPSVRVDRSIDKHGC